jgi:biopolymer transport protein ExbB
MFETYEVLRQGGWPMIPLGVCSLLALAIIIERAFALRRHRIIEAPVLQVIGIHGSTVDPGPALAVCERTGGPLARIVTEVIRSRELDHHQAIEKLHAAGRIQVERLERGLTLLEIIAGISPLIGLLGTVLGMLSVFQTITREGLGDPALLADGIGEALVTTVAGLCVGIPALAFHTLFTKRVDQLAGEMQDRAVGYLVRLQAGRGRSETVDD